MRHIGVIGGAVLLASALAGCRENGDAAGKAEGAALDVRATMQNQVNPATLAVWDVGNNAMNDDGGIDPAKMDDAKWSLLAENSAKMAEAGRQMAAATAIKAASEGNTTVVDGEITMAAVQAALDADADGFRSQAAAFAQYTDKMAAAAKAKDVKVAGDLVAGIDQVCESCHLKFWYPDQQ